MRCVLPSPRQPTIVIRKDSLVIRAVISNFVLYTTLEVGETLDDPLKVHNLFQTIWKCIGDIYSFIISLRNDYALITKIIPQNMVFPT